MAMLLIRGDEGAVMKKSVLLKFGMVGLAALAIPLNVYADMDLITSADSITARVKTDLGLHGILAYVTMSGTDSEDGGATESQVLCLARQAKELLKLPESRKGHFFDLDLSLKEKANVSVVPGNVVIKAHLDQSGECSIVPIQEIAQAASQTPEVIWDADAHRKMIKTIDEYLSSPSESEGDRSVTQMSEAEYKKLPETSLVTVPRSQPPESNKAE